MDTILLEKISSVGINLREDQIRSMLKIKDVKNTEDQIKIYKDIVSQLFYVEEYRQYIKIPKIYFDFKDTGDGWGIETELNILEEVEGRSVLLEEYARELIMSEELHLGEVDKMLRAPGSTESIIKN